MKLIMKDGTEVECACIYYQKSAQQANEHGIVYNVKFEKEHKPMVILGKIDTLFSTENISDLKAIVKEGEEVLEFSFSEVADFSLNVSSDRVSLDIRLRLMA